VVGDDELLEVPVRRGGAGYDELLEVPARRGGAGDSELLEVLARASTDPTATPHLRLLLLRRREARWRRGRERIRPPSPPPPQIEAPARAGVDPAAAPHLRVLLIRYGSSPSPAYSIPTHAAAAAGGLWRIGAQSSGAFLLLHLPPHAGVNCREAMRDRKRITTATLPPLRNGIVCASVRFAYAQREFAGDSLTYRWNP
jgi:hypothetical protein